MNEPLQEHLQSLILKLALSSGTHGLGIDQDGSPSLLVDGDLEVHFQRGDDDHSLVLLSCVGTLPHAGQGEAALKGLRWLAEANYMWLGGDGFTLCCEPESYEVLLAGRISIAALAAEPFPEHLARFIDAGRHWSDLLGALSRVEALRPVTPPAPRRGRKAEMRIS